MPPSPELKIVVVGGGAIGSAVALFLKRLGGTAVQVDVVEPDPGLALASSARSASSIRQQFSNPINMRMSRFGHGFIRAADETLAVEGQVPPIGLVDSGYLFLASEAGAATLRANHAAQQAEAVKTVLLTPQQLAQRLPWLRCDDLALASLGLEGEGWFDGYALARALAAKARALGARWQRARVLDFERTGRRLTAAQLDDGHQLAADAFVNAAGPWARQVAALAGITLPVHARRRTVFAFDSPLKLAHTPLVADASGVWFRSEGAGYIGGWTPGPQDEDADDLPLDEPDLAQFEQRLWPALAHRVPALEALRMRRAWAGYYEVHPLDHNAVIGPHPALDNLVFVNGFSGHGLQHAPAAGRGVAEWLLNGRYDTLDLTPLGWARVLAQQPFVEQAVI